jgi:hypothetical protein
MPDGRVEMSMTLRAIGKFVMNGAPLPTTIVRVGIHAANPASYLLKEPHHAVDATASSRMLFEPPSFPFMETNMRTIVIRVSLAAIAFIIGAHAAPAQEVAGHWRGQWNDTKSGHKGPLKANIVKCDDAHYRATFTGRFFGVFPFRFSTVLAITGHEGDAVLLSGSSNLGLLFGTFTYNARVTANCFVADFCSARYQGRFVMERDCSSCYIHH